MSTNDKKEFLFIEDPGVGRVIDRLHKGMLIKSRIVLKLSEHHYALRLFGYNLLMESKLNFSRFDEIFIEVVKTKPKLVLKLQRMRNAAKSRHQKNRSTNIYI